MASLSQHGGQITATTAGETASGKYADGSDWLTHSGGGVSLTATTPAAGTASRSTAEGTQSLYSHGIMLNPGNAEIYKATGAPTLTTLALKQRYANAAPEVYLGQGWDSYFFSPSSTILYHSPYSVSLPASGTELTWLKARSKITGVGRAGIIEYFAPITVIPVAKQPAADGARPGLALADKTSRWKKSDILVSRLSNATPSGFTPMTYAWCMNIVQQFDAHAFTYNVFSQGLIASNGTTQVSTYQGFVAQDFAEAMLSLQYNIMTETQKRDVAFWICQHAEDIRAAALEGKIWPDNGGHAHGRKTLLAFAERLLPGLFADAVNTVVVSTINADTPIPVGASIWGGDDGQYGLIAQSDINRGGTWPYEQNKLGLAEWAGEWTRGSLAGRIDGMDVATGDNGQEYRGIVAKGAIPAALALSIMGARTDYNNEVWFNYQNRHMTARIAKAAPFPDEVFNDINLWLIPAWTQAGGVAGGGGGVGPGTITGSGVSGRTVSFVKV